MAFVRQQALPIAGAQPSAQPDLLDLAAELYGVLTDGAPAAGYHVRRGYATRNATTKQPLRDSYTGTWLPARDRHPDGRETDRAFNHFILAQHLRGRYDVAWTAPSWSSLAVLDIDRRKLPDDATPEDLLAANLDRDVVLAEVWRAFDFGPDRQPVVLGTPGGGYHLYLPYCRTTEPNERERTWPNAWAREWLEHVLDQAGVVRRPGRLELYPSGVRLRAPCGRGSALLVPQRPDEPDDLRLQPVHARAVDVIDGKTGHVATVLRRSIAPMTRAFLDAVAAARRPLEQWFASEDARPAWSDRWGPFGDRGPGVELPGGKKLRLQFSAHTRLSPHKEEVQRAPGLPGASEPAAGDGVLLRGRAFYERVAELSHVGLTDPGTRHDGALKLAGYLGVLCRVGREEVLRRVELWLHEHEHASVTRERSPAGFVRQTMREVRHYYDTRIVRCATRVGVRVPELAHGPLAPADEALLLRVSAEARDAAGAILRLLAGHADAQGRVPHPVELSGTVMRSVSGGGDRRITCVAEDGTRSRRRAYVVALEELVRLGVLALHCDYSTGHHGRLYTCWYEFGSGVLPRDAGDAGLVLAERPIEEGVLRVLATEDDPRPVVELVRSTAVAGGGPPGGDDPWWVRMYQRRAFTPAEFLEADARNVLPGPFRHRYPAGARTAPRTPRKPPEGLAPALERVQPPPDRTSPGAASPPPRTAPALSPAPPALVPPSPSRARDAPAAAPAPRRSTSVPSPPPSAPPPTELERHVQTLGTADADPAALAALLWARRCDSEPDT